MNIRNQSTGMDGPLANRWKRIAVWGIAGAVIAAAAVLGPTALAWSAQAVAKHHLDTGALGAAEVWLARAERWSAGDGRTDLLRARCYRHMGQQTPWKVAMAAATEHGAANEQLELENRLAQLQWGLQGDISNDDVEALCRKGASPREAVTAVVQGLAARKESALARQSLESWAPQIQDEAQVAYLRGLCCWADNDREAARTEFESALAAHPSHVMARASAARVFEQQERLSEALAQYAHLASSLRYWESLRVDTARVLRRLGQLELAAEVLPVPESPASGSPAAALEIAEREYERGNYAEAGRWFDQAGLTGAHLAETLRTAASARALQGDRAGADELFARVDTTQDFSRHATELQHRLTVDPSDRVATSELQRLVDATAENRPRSEDQANPLYLQRCAGCHGKDGNGAGPAARFLSPRPRNLRRDRFRLVSTRSGIPSDQDLERVIRHGMPGTAMPPFLNATADELRQLVEQVHEFQRAGLRDEVIAELLANDEPIDGERVNRIVAQLTMPGPEFPVPSLASGTPASIARGEEVYRRAGCHHCHGPDGRGASGIALFDEDGRPVLPRDLTRDPMKGGADARSLYLRIALGMPGTPHPSAPGIDSEQLVQLVHYCQSLAVQPSRELTNYERAVRGN